MLGRSSSKLTLTSCAAALLFGLHACGDDSAGPKIALPQADAATSGDAALDSDAGPAEDDAGAKEEPFDPSRDCKLVEERAELARPVTFGDESGFALTPGLVGFGVAYQSDSCGAISVLPVASRGEYAEPKSLFTSCSTVAQGVSLVYHGEGYRLSWVDNSTGSAELHALGLSSSLELPSNPERTPLTSNSVRELAPVQAILTGKPYVAWISQDGSERAIMLQGSGSEAQAVIAAAEQYRPTRLALAQLGDSAAALAFVSETQKPGVYLLPLSAQGEPSAAVQQLTAAVSSGNSVDLATRLEDGGAVVYSLDVGGRHEVRFRRLDKQGAITSSEVKVASYPLEGRDASIARLGGGYAIAFRSPIADAPERAQIRLVFITKEGNLQRDRAGNIPSYEIAEASATGGRLTARVSQDGQLLIGFLDTNANDQGVQLRLIRKRLDCAL